MAHRYWGINQGQHQTDVAEAAISNTTDVEVNLDLSKNLSRDDVLRALDYIRNIIVQDNWPPA